MFESVSLSDLPNVESPASYAKQIADSPPKTGSAIKVKLKNSSQLNSFRAMLAYYCRDKTYKIATQTEVRLDGVIVFCTTKEKK